MTRVEVARLKAQLSRYLDVAKHGEEVVIWVKFPTPPAGVEKITVVIATPPFDDVAIAT